MENAPITAIISAIFFLIIAGIILFFILKDAFKQLKNENKE